MRVYIAHLLHGLILVSEIYWGLYPFLLDFSI